MSPAPSRPPARVVWLLGGAAFVAGAALVARMSDVTVPESMPEARRETHPADAPVFDAGPAAAGMMVDRLQLFRTGNGGSRIELDGPELTSIIRHAVPGVIPAGVTNPSVHIVDGEVRVHAHVSPALVPGGRYLAEAVEALPESVEVELRGRLETERPGSIAYRVKDVLVEGVALPRPVVALVIGAIQPGDGSSEEAPSGEGGDVPVLSEDAARAPVLRMRWPADAGVLRVVSDRVVLERVEPLPGQSVDGSGGA